MVLRIGSRSQSPATSSEGDSSRLRKRPRFQLSSSEINIPIELINTPNVLNLGGELMPSEKESAIQSRSSSPAPELTYRSLGSYEGTSDIPEQITDGLSEALDLYHKFPFKDADDKASKDTSQENVDLLEIMLEEQGKQTSLEVLSTASQEKDRYSAYGYQASTSYAPPNITQGTITVDEHPTSIPHLNESPVGGQGVLDTSHPFIESESDIDLASQVYKIYQQFDTNEASTSYQRSTNPNQPDDKISVKKWCERAGLYAQKLQKTKSGNSLLYFDEFIALVIADKFKKNITELTEDEKNTPIFNIKKDIDNILEYLKKNDYIKGHQDYNEFVTHIFDDDYKDIYRNIDILRKISPYLSLHSFFTQNNINKIGIYTTLYQAKLNQNLTPEELEGLLKTQKNNYDEATFEEIKGKFKLMEDAKASSNPLENQADNSVGNDLCNESYKKSSTTKESKNLVARPLSLKTYIKAIIPIHKILFEYQEDGIDDKIYLEKIDIENDKHKHKKIILLVKNILKFCNIYLTQDVNNKIDTMLKNNTEFKKAIGKVKFKEKKLNDIQLDVRNKMLETRF